MSIHNDYNIQVYDNIKELSLLYKDWQPRITEINADFDFYLTVLQSRAEVVSPHVIVVSLNGVQETLLMGRYEIRSLDIAFGYKKIKVPRIKHITFVYGGLIGDCCENNLSLLIRSIEKTLKSGSVDLVTFHNLDVDGRFFKMVSEAGGIFRRDYFPTLLDHWKTQLPKSFDELIGQRPRKSRYNLKRMVKKFENTFGELILIKKHQHIAELPAVLSDCETVAAKAYQRGLRVGFVDNEEHCRLIKLAASRNWLRSYMLYLGGKPIAFWNGLVYQKSFSFWTTAYDPTYSDYDPGAFLIYKVIEDVYAENGIAELDFGFGDALYKRQWANMNQREGILLLFAPTLRGVLLNGFRTPLTAVSIAGKALLKKAGVMQVIKRRWRERLK